MTLIYADTSSLVKFYYPEADSEKIEALLLKTDRIFISHLTVTEMASALAKKVRMGDLKKEKETVLWNTFLDDMQTEKIELIPLDERHYLKAADFIRELGGRYGLKTLDALHLSIAHSLQTSQVAAKIGIKLVRMS
ncbi:MAG: PilT protein [Deltaproteobacteria bacterium]|nr:PilT protein [Deltaproteobacteria bacterium]